MRRIGSIWILSIFSISILTSTSAQLYNSSFGKACSTSNNRLAPDTNQFLSDCGYAAWCNPTSNTCTRNGCRKDEYPFGMGPRREWPPLCSSGQFCPDEGSQCMNLQSQGDPCQLNRDDECASSPSSSRSSGVKPICLNLKCRETNVKIGDTCENENTVYTVFLGGGATAGEVVSRDNCISSAYCDYTTSTCLSKLISSSPCSADKECLSGICSSSTFSFNNLANGFCTSSMISTSVPIYAYVLVALGIVLGSVLMVYLLVRTHTKARRNTKLEREEFVKEEKKWRDEINNEQLNAAGGWTTNFNDSSFHGNGDGNEVWERGDGGRSSSPGGNDLDADSSSYTYRDGRYDTSEKVSQEAEGLRRRGEGENHHPL